MVVVRGSPRIHVRANGRGRVHEDERVAEGQTTSARSYALLLILILALARGLRVTQEEIVGR
jgi:hypothetical protein